MQLLINQNKCTVRQKFGLVEPEDVYVEWRWSGQWFQIVYIIYLLVFHSVLLSLKQFSCALFLCGSLRAFFAPISTFYKVYCTKQIYADNLHNKCRGLSDWVGCKIARISILKEPNKAQIPMLRWFFLNECLELRDFDWQHTENRYFELLVWMLSCCLCHQDLPNPRCSFTSI